MHTDQNIEYYPDLALLAGRYWYDEPPDPPSDYSSSHEIESLKLYARIVWPMPDMDDRRRQFLAQSALQLRIKYMDIEDSIKLNEDGFHSKDGQRALVRLYDQISKQSKLNLLDPSGGITVALQSGLLQVKQDIDDQLKKIWAGIFVGDFLLRYMAHFPNDRRGASVNRAVFFIEAGGYGADAVNVPRHRSEIMKAWSQAKSSIIFSLASFYSERTLISNISDQCDSAECLEKIWQDDLNRERFFGIANYCETQLTKLEPNRSKHRLLILPSRMSTMDLPGLTACCPILRPFTEEDQAMLSRYRAPTSI